MQRVSRPTSRPTRIWGASIASGTSESDRPMASPCSWGQTAEQQNLPRTIFAAVMAPAPQSHMVLACSDRGDPLVSCSACPRHSGVFDALLRPEL
jgi:hypothetical protein